VGPLVLGTNLPEESLEERSANSFPTLVDAGNVLRGQSISRYAEAKVGKVIQRARIRTITNTLNKGRR
jgi:hypothetical protein